LQEFFANVVLIVTATTLFYAALTDLREFKIRNEFIVILACLYGIYAFLTGQWVAAHWNIGLALFMFAVMMYFYAHNMLGGGDVKILTVAFLWTGARYALPFSLILLVFGTGHVLLSKKFSWVSVRHTGGRARIPFAPAVAAGLIGVFVLRWNGF
jgi:prepilin peptidase CpaA